MIHNLNKNKANHISNVFREDTERRELIDFIEKGKKAVVVRS